MNAVVNFAPEPHSVEWRDLPEPVIGDGDVLLEVRQADAHPGASVVLAELEEAIADRSMAVADQDTGHSASRA